MEVRWRSGDLLLRSWVEDDAPSLAEIGNDPSVAAQMNDGFPSPFTLEKAQAFIGRARGSSDLWLAIVHGATVIGSLAAFFDGDDPRKATVAYFLGSSHGNRGYGTRALSGLVELLVKERGIRLVEADPLEQNGRSRRVLEKNGFLCLGVTQGGRMKEGQPRDVCHYEYRVGGPSQAIPTEVPR